MNERAYSKDSFNAILVEDDNGLVPGMFFYLYKDLRRIGIESCLPSSGGLPPTWGVTMFKGYGIPNHEWTWNGNVEKPTLQPSIHRLGHWHGHLKDGKFISVGKK